MVTNLDLSFSEDLCCADALRLHLYYSCTEIFILLTLEHQY